MTVFPKVKLKTVPTFPSSIIGGTGVEITKQNGAATVDLAFQEFATISSIPTSPTNNVVTYDTATDVYVMVPSHLLGGGTAGISDAPIDGTQYVRTSGGWQNPMFQQAGTGAVLRLARDKERDIFCVLDFGVVGDGSDESIKIQTAITAIQTRGNGALYFPGGRVYSGTNLSFSGGSIYLYGDGPSTVLSNASTNATLFTGSNGDITIANMKIQHPTRDASTAGYFLYFYSAHANVRDVDFLNGYNAVRWGDGCNQCGATNVTSFNLKNDCFVVDVSAAPPPAAQSGNIMFDRVSVQGSDTNTGAGIRAISCDGLFVSNSLVAGYYVDVSAVPTAGRSYLANLYFNCVCGDGAGGPAAMAGAWYFDGTNGPLLRVFLTNCWANSSGTGVEVKNTKIFHWISGSIIGNPTYGIVIDSGSYEVLLEGASVTGNGYRTANTYDGILINTGADKVRIKNCRSGASFSSTDATTQPNYQRYGINVGDPSTVNYELIGNDVTANISGGILDNGGSASGAGKRIVRDNLGYNPIGMVALTPTASPWTYSARGVFETVYIAGGTVTSITIGGVTVATFVSGTPDVIALSPNQTMVVTYTGAAPPITVANRQ